MPLSNEQISLLGNVGRYERQFLAKVIREQIRIIEQNKKMLEYVPTKYVNAKSHSLNEISKAESLISEIEYQLEVSFERKVHFDFLWEGGIE